MLLGRAAVRPNKCPHGRGLPARMSRASITLGRCLSSFQIRDPYKYGRAVLEREVRGVYSEPSLNRSAYKLAQILGMCGLDETEVATRLVEAAVSAGVREPEARKTVLGAMSRGKANPR